MVHNILTALLNHHGYNQLDDESLSTYFAEAIVNCCPLTVDDLNNADGPVPLGPCQLLTMKSSVVLPPPGVFQGEDLHSRKRWRTVKFLVNEFYNNWKADYLQLLQMRQK